MKKQSDWYPMLGWACFIVRREIYRRELLSCCQFETNWSEIYKRECFVLSVWDKLKWNLQKRVFRVISLRRTEAKFTGVGFVLSVWDKLKWNLEKRVAFMLSVWDKLKPSHWGEMPLEQFWVEIFSLHMDGIRQDNGIR